MLKKGNARPFQGRAQILVYACAKYVLSLRTLVIVYASTEASDFIVAFSVNPWLDRVIRRPMRVPTTATATSANADVDAAGRSGTRAR